MYVYGSLRVIAKALADFFAEFICGLISTERPGDANILNMSTPAVQIDPHLQI